jgi:hypothetical protein
VDKLSLREQNICGLVGGGIVALIIMVVGWLAT